VTDFGKKNTQISNFLKIRPIGAELFHADGQTNIHDEASSRFSQYCVRAKKWLQNVICNTRREKSLRKYVVGEETIIRICEPNSKPTFLLHRFVFQHIYQYYKLF